MGHSKIKTAQIMIWFWGLMQWGSYSKLTNTCWLGDGEHSVWGILSELKVTGQKFLLPPIWERQMVLRGNEFNTQQWQPWWFPRVSLSGIAQQTRYRGADAHRIGIQVQLCFLAASLDKSKQPASSFYVIKDWTREKNFSLHCENIHLMLWVGCSSECFLQSR